MSGAWVLLLVPVAVAATGALLGFLGKMIAHLFGAAIRAGSRFLEKSWKGQLKTLVALLFFGMATLLVPFESAIELWTEASEKGWVRSLEVLKAQKIWWEVTALHLGWGVGGFVLAWIFHKAVGGITKAMQVPIWRK